MHANILFWHDSVKINSKLEITVNPMHLFCMNVNYETSQIIVLLNTIHLNELLYEYYRIIIIFWPKFVKKNKTIRTKISVLR